MPTRHSFHLSLTVLVRYRSHAIFSLRRWSSQIPTEFHVLRSTRDSLRETGRISPTGLSPSVARRSRRLRLFASFVTLRKLHTASTSLSHDPNQTKVCPYRYGRFRLFPFRSPLLRESSFLSFPRVTEMVQFTRFPSLPY